MRRVLRGGQFVKTNQTSQNSKLTLHIIDVRLFETARPLGRRHYHRCGRQLFRMVVLRFDACYHRASDQYTDLLKCILPEFSHDLNNKLSPFCCGHISGVSSSTCSMLIRSSRSSPPSAKAIGGFDVILSSVSTTGLHLPPNFILLLLLRTSFLDMVLRDRTTRVAFTLNA